ncbi:MAG: hypothetical protein WB760_12835 [Xanthobacteraceae bacterium]
MTSSASDPVPAVTEATASGEIAAIFADIRQVLGVEVVNLVWRHLATIPDALPWTWGILRPLYINGRIAAEAATLHNDLDLPRLPQFPAEAFAAVDLLGGDVSTIRHVLAACDRTNAMALIALSGLLCRLDSEPSARNLASSLGVGVVYEPPPSIPLPSLPAMAELPPATAELVLILNRLGTQRDDAVLASMYRHLAYWPAYLALTWTLIAPMDADGSLDRSIADAMAKARVRATRVAMRLHDPSAAPIDPTLNDAVRAAVEPFAGDVIAKMVVICALLRAATGASQASPL